MSSSSPLRVSTDDVGTHDASPQNYPEALFSLSFTAEGRKLHIHQVGECGTPKDAEGHATPPMVKTTSLSPPPPPPPRCSILDEHMTDEEGIADNQRGVNPLKEGEGKQQQKQRQERAEGKKVKNDPLLSQIRCLPVPANFATAEEQPPPHPTLVAIPSSNFWCPWLPQDEKPGLAHHIHDNSFTPLGRCREPGRGVESAMNIDDDDDGSAGRRTPTNAAKDDLYTGALDDRWRTTSVVTRTQGNNSKDGGINDSEEEDDRVGADDDSFDLATADGPNNGRTTSHRSRSVNLANHTTLLRQLSTPSVSSHVAGNDGAVVVLAAKSKRASSVPSQQSDPFFSPIAEVSSSAVTTATPHSAPATTTTTTIAFPKATVAAVSYPWLGASSSLAVTRHWRRRRRWGTAATPPRPPNATPGQNSDGRPMSVMDNIAASPRASFASFSISATSSLSPWTPANTNPRDAMTVQPRPILSEIQKQQHDEEEEQGVEERRIQRCGLERDEFSESSFEAGGHDEPRTFFLQPRRLVTTLSATSTVAAPSLPLHPEPCPRRDYTSFRQPQQREDNHEAEEVPKNLSLVSAVTPQNGCKRKR